MFSLIQQNGFRKLFDNVTARLTHQLRCFSVLENKLAFIDILGDGDEFEEVDRNGMKLPPFGSLISYTAQREYHIGIYEGTKMIDGIQKIQVRNEHDCVRDVGMGCLNCLIALPSPVIPQYSAKDVEDTQTSIETLFKSARLPLDKIYSKFACYERFNVEQVLPYLPSKLRNKYNKAVLIGFTDRVLHNSNHLVEKQTTDWSQFSEYKCQPRQYLSLLKYNYAHNEKINSIFRDCSNFTSKECDEFVSQFKSINKENEKEVNTLISSFPRIINSLTVLASIYSPSESNFSDFALIRDHILLPLFGTKDESNQYPLSCISTIHHHTADILRSLHLLEKYYPVQFLLDRKCGYTGFSPNCEKAAKKILDSFFVSPSKGSDELSWDLVDDFAEYRTQFSKVAIAIDSISTSEVDDSISYIGKNKVAIHIADPTSFIPLGSELDFNASLRSVTYYYPNRVYPLYPWQIATTCSLSTTQFNDTNPENRYHPSSLLSASGSNTPRPRSLTIFIEFDDNGEIIDSSIETTVLENPIRLTYEEVETILNTTQIEETAKEAFTPSTSLSSENQSEYMKLIDLKNKDVNIKRLSKRQQIQVNASLLGFKQSSSSESVSSLESIYKRVSLPSISSTTIATSISSLYQLACKRRLYREQKGCIDFTFPEARFHVYDDKVEGCIDSDNVGMKSEKLVMEMMVAAGEVIGQIGKDNHLPLPYRVHPYNVLLPSDQMQQRFHNWEQLIRCLPAKVSREAGCHSGLGINSYVQVTSPLRRYNDCLVHRQLKAFIHHQPLPYSEDTMFRIGTKCFQMEKMSTRFEDSWNRYIILQKMKDNLIQAGQLTLHGTVLDVSIRGMNTVICSLVMNDLGLRFNVTSATIPQKGEQVDVDILDVVPDCLKVKASLTGPLKVDEEADYSKVL